MPALFSNYRRTDLSFQVAAAAAAPAASAACFSPA